MNTEFSEKTDEELVEQLDTLYMAIPEPEKKLVGRIVEVERELTLRGS